MPMRSVKLPAQVVKRRSPEIPSAIYLTRIATTVKRMRDAKLDALVVYGDREHFANIAYLTGFDPRFEDALLLIGRDGNLRLLVGNECMGYLPHPDLAIPSELFQDFSLMGQPRDCSRSLRIILREFGISHGVTIGCAGWKYFEGRPADIEIPSYIVNLLRELAGADSCVTNANTIFMHPLDGLRVINEPEQIAQFEYAADITSSGVLKLLRHLRVGVPECNLEKYLDSRGLPLTCHRMISFGDKARRGLASPSSNRARLGDAFTVAFGVNGALTCRAGVVAHGPQDLSAPLKDFYPQFVENYFAMTVAWYESIRVGAVAGSVFTNVESVRNKKLFDLAVNPGHYLHLDEWVNSPFASGSQLGLKSGMVIQMDIIPLSKGPFCYSNAEDGVVLADQTLQKELAQYCPATYSRMLRRREFIRKNLGIHLDDSVLPLSDTTGWLAPYALQLDTAFVNNK